MTLFADSPNNKVFAGESSTTNTGSGCVCGSQHFGTQLTFACADLMHKWLIAETEKTGITTQLQYETIQRTEKDEVKEERNTETIYQFLWNIGPYRFKYQNMTDIKIEIIMNYHDNNYIPKYTLKEKETHHCFCNTFFWLLIFKINFTITHQPYTRPWYSDPINRCLWQFQ